LSRKEGLKPVYHFSGNKLVSVDINGDGYRLPTEAEWEWLARKAGRDHETRFPWGNSSIIPKLTGNFADESAKNLVKTYIPDYNDGYKKLAPVGRFNKNASGLYDLAGNVSEWVHDYYRLTPPDPGRIFRNPSGPATGQTHVVKGSSWRSGTVTELRGAYRDTSASGRDDLGFRVVRYLYGKEK
ncbi:MAG: formylglycine-generating enzyme family protein, partial [Alphaproteobacteria bacterium]|nr:formylglycine-generating enzyme family protein [Alphaproteobacteria bacterium]